MTTGRTKQQCRIALVSVVLLAVVGCAPTREQECFTLQESIKSATLDGRQAVANELIKEFDAKCTESEPPETAFPP